MHVFPDTNVLLHWRRLDELPLPTLFECDQVHVVIALEVVHELDKHKRAPTKRLQNGPRPQSAGFEKPDIAADRFAKASR